MVCCCRKSEEFREFASPTNEANSNDAVKSIQMERQVDDDDVNDDDSDKQAVRWMRNRSLEKSRSSSSEKTPSPPNAERKVMASPPNSDNSNRSRPSPVCLDTLLATPDGVSRDNDDNHDVFRLDKQVVMQPEEPAASPLSNGEKASSPIALSLSESDKEAQGKYNEACRLLHKTLIEKKDKLTESEHAFLGELVTSIDSADTKQESLSSAVSDVESAVHVLETDPLFQNGDQARNESTRSNSQSSNQNNLFPDDPMSISFSGENDSPQRVESKRSSLSSSDQVMAQEHFPSFSGEDGVSPKASMESSNGHDKFFPDDPMASMESNPSPLSSNGHAADPPAFGFSTFPEHELSGAIQHVTDTEKEAGFEIPLVAGDHWWDFRKGEEAPNLVDDDPLPTPSKRPKQEEEEQVLVRFDGWALSKGEAGPFRILGTSSDDKGAKPHVVSPLLMEALRGFLPFVVSEENFWLKYSLVRDGASLETMLHSIRASAWTVIGIETIDGDVFGSFTGTPWRVQPGWFGSGQAFLWRLKKSRFATQKAIREKPNFDSEMEVYPYTGADNLVQFCTEKTLAVGGGDWNVQESPHRGEPQGIGLQIDGDLAGGETNSCATFANPRLCSHTRTQRRNEFDISNLEVWTLTPCTTVGDAEKLELRKLFVEEHRSF